MKKLFSLFAIITIALSTSSAFCTENMMHQDFNRPSKEQMRREFEQRLNLTDKQKQKARDLHKQGQEQMRPIIMQLEVKRQEIETVKLSRIAERAQQERIAKINSEIKELEKKAQEIRKNNSQEFEKLLNKKQKAELEKMKAEGRLRYEKYHSARPPFNGLGSPSFLLRPILPPKGEFNRFSK